MITSRQLMARAALITGIISFTPAASATVCDQSKLERLSTADAAQLVLDNSDVVGIGAAVDDNGSGSVLRQKVVFAEIVKGTNREARLSPYRTGNVGVHDGWVRKFEGRINQQRLFALTEQGDGYVGGKCILAALMTFPQDHMLDALRNAARDATDRFTR